MTSLLALRDIKADVAFAKRAKADYIEDKLNKFNSRNLRSCPPVIALCGPGRCGKDIGAQWLSSTFTNTRRDVRYAGSLSSVVCPIVAAALTISEYTCFENRHEDREYWYRFCNELRRDDPTLLVKMLLADADLVPGIRGLEELRACLEQNVIQLAVWVDRNVPTDPTLEYGPEACHVTISNRGSVDEYRSRLNALGGVIYGNLGYTIV